MGGMEGVNVYVKIYETESGTLIAACEEKLLGVRLVDEEKGINIYIDPQFYKGRLVSLEEALSMLRNAPMGNIVGNSIVELAVREGLVSSESVLDVKGVKIAMFCTL
ncbi:DUF424 domain-containing protein [Thermogladius sp. 4427co]|uniref:DUF424 domain-containing protein n=1 Tax=Thermogladius sp. 4427co TaxID=3450718 RepID=UPI003F7A972A